EGGRRACAGSEQANRERGRLRVRLRPIDSAAQAIREQRDVESKFRGDGVDTIFLLGEQVEQQRAEAAMLEDLGNDSIPRTVAAAAAAVRENDEATLVWRQAEVPIEGRIDQIESNRLRSEAFGRRTHAIPERN